MKSLLLACIFLIATSAYADPCETDNFPDQGGPLSHLAENLDPVVQLQLGVGVSHFPLTENGTWYQEGFPYRADQVNPSVKIGLEFKLTDTTHIQLGFHDLAANNYGMSAIAVDSDASYAACRYNHAICYKTSHWFGSGDVQGAYLTVDQDIPIRDGAFVLEAGLAAERYTWQEVIPDQYADPGVQANPTPYYHSITHKPNISPGFILGVGYKINKDSTVMLNVEHFKVNATDGYPPGFGTTVWSLWYVKNFKQF
jgi:hypothetical protein